MQSEGRGILANDRRGEEVRDVTDCFLARRLVQSLDDSSNKETVGYVPNFFAAAIIGENPAAFGLQTPPLSTLSSVVER